ncbi:MAG: WD40/YVTN/BNR-like repeat-containing protein [Flavisolibacter sp.]
MRKLLCLLSFTISFIAYGQKKKSQIESESGDSILLSKIKYRLIGPFRGGRSAAVAGSYRNKNTFYFGSVGGGVWKTSDGGSNWKNSTDKTFGGSIGAVAIAPSDENIVYVGEGENTLRGNESEGLHGMWRSEDAGRTWKNLGLHDARHISRIVVHPRDPNTLWIAVMGHSFGSNVNRGIYKSTDGGKTWRKTLYANDSTGACELVMEPGNANTLYAGMWHVIRTPYSLESGGKGSGLFKSTDGGETWSDISLNKGLPKGIWGIVGVSVSQSNPDKVYAIIENKNGGLYASTDGGNTWSLTSNDNNIRQRAWYYSKVFTDPKNENLVYVLNVNMMRSRDGGKTFQSVSTPHGDTHDLWIDPEDGNRMILGDDGGAQISFDGGTNWSSLMNQPTAQIYRVSTDNSFPYRILGAQQDNTTVRIKSRTYGAYIGDKDWEPTAGAESGYVVADPLNPDIVYGGNYGGYISRLDHKTGENRAVSPWPDNPMGAGADVLKYRFQWNFPIFFSPHNPKRLYTAGNVLFVTENEGQTWEQISPDLTTNDKSKQTPSGGPITKDNTSVEYYCTIFTATESPLEKDLLWSGSDDGLIYVSKDAGKNWENVTPKEAPKWMMWNCVEVDQFKKGAAYFVGTRYKLDDFTPYIYKTEDYGKTWKAITNGINKMHFARCLRQDPKRKGLLYAGTEYGMYISFNDGEYWKPFQQNLPETPVTDLTIKENDLIVATQGRSFYVLDDLSVLQQLNNSITNKQLFVFNVTPAYRMQVSRFYSNFGTQGNYGQNPPSGVLFNYFVRQLSDSVKASITILDNDHKEIKRFYTNAKEADSMLDIQKGMNQFVWDMKYPGPEKNDGMILWNGTPSAITAPPGNYFARFKLEQDSIEVPFIIKADPNYKIAQQDYEEQFKFLKQVSDKFIEVQKAIKDIRSLRSQINSFIDLQGKNVPADVKHMADSIIKQLSSIEETLYQTKAKSIQDVLNYPIKLNDKLAGVFDAAASANISPSKQVRSVYDDLSAQINIQLSKLNNLKQAEIPAFNQLIRQKALPLIGLQ